MNRVVDSTFSVNSSGTILGNSLNDSNIGFVKVFPKYGVRLDFDINVSD